MPKVLIDKALEKAANEANMSVKAMR